MDDEEAQREAAARRLDEALLRELAELLERDDPVPKEARAGAGRKQQPGARRRDTPSGDDD